MPVAKPFILEFSINKVTWVHGDEQQYSFSMSIQQIEDQILRIQRTRSKYDLREDFELHMKMYQDALRKYHAWVDKTRPFSKKKKSDTVTSLKAGNR